MSDAQASAGQRLKAERERRGLSTQKAANELLLDDWVVVALEADDYQRVGAPVFIKGHLKRYAALLGIPVDDILAAYQSRAQAPVLPAETANVRMLNAAPPVINLSQSQMIGTAAAVLLLAAVLWWKPWQQRGARPAASSSPPAGAPAPHPCRPRARWQSCDPSGQ